jgi:8-oxo-dGTP diphosphatase
MTKNDVINGIFVNDGVSLEQKLRDKHKDILPAIDKRYTLTVVFAPNRAQVLMVLHNKQHMLNFVGGHIEPGEDEMEASYCELFEETGITKDDIDLKFVQSEHCIASFANPEWYLYVTTGVLKHDVEFKEEKNSLHWVFVTDDHVLLHDTFGNGNCFVFMQRALLALEDE